MAQSFRFEYFGQVPSRVYAGARTRKGPVAYSCPCGERFRAEVYYVLDSDEGAAFDKLCDGTLNRVRCPSCGLASDVQVPVVFHDLAKPRLTLVLPDALRHRELAERGALLTMLAAENEPAPLYVLEPEVVFGAAGLRASLAPQPSSGDFAAATAVTTPAVPLPSLSDTDQTPVSDVATRLRITVPDPRQTVIDRWIASREGPATFLVEDQVMAVAALSSEALEHFAAGPVELRVQLHRLPSYPIVTLTFVAGKSEVPVEDQVLSVPLDLARAAHRVVLEALGRKSRLTLELYDPDYLPVVQHKVTAPLEENVRRIIVEAKDALERLAPATRSFERARATLVAPKYDRLGHTDVDLPRDADMLEMPSAVRRALQQVARWSEPSAEAYLLEIRSLPLGQWRALRARVIRRALDAGIAVAKPLVERSAKEHMAPLPSWPELLEIGVRRFAEVASRQRPNDLSAVDEAENWELLLRECALAGVAVDDKVRELATAAQRRVRATTSGVDLRSLGSDELVALLERKELRREAALILCERRDPALLPAVFSAIRRMARAEANVVLPAVTSFGAAAEKWFMEGLKSKKSFMRQGCALGLGALKTPHGVDALVHLLLDEPTEIWGEVARALGDAGPMAVMPLAARIREVDSDHRDRIVHALAQVAARPENQARSPVEMLAEGRDALVAAAAQRALGLIADIQREDQNVRRGTTDATVVRGFSRRFYDAISGSIELSPADLEEISDDDDEGKKADGDDDIRTATDLPVLTTASGEINDSTAPQPRRTSLPRDR
jgi:CpXC protein